MNGTQALQLTVELANAQMARQLKHAETLLRQLGADADELQAALGPDGYARRLAREDRDVQIAEAEKLFTPVTLH